MSFIISPYQFAAAASFDPDAQAFFTAYGITDNTQKNAINTLVLAMKADGTWTKMSAIWPIVGGTSTTHAGNLKSPGTFDLTFVNSPTHSSTGIDWNGTTQYATTGIAPSVVFANNNTCMGYYSGDNSSADTDILMGCVNGGTNIFQININAANGILGSTASIASFTPSRRDGLFIVNRQSSTDLKVYRQGTEVASNTSSDTVLPTNAMFLAARNSSGTPELYATQQCRFAFVGTFLTTSQVASLQTAIQQYQTDLGRAV